MPKKEPKHSFSDPAIRAKAHALAKGVKRPNRKGKKKLVEEVKKEIIKTELIRSGYMEALQKNLPRVLKAHFAVASKARASATQERKLLFEAAGFKKDDGDTDVGKTIGQVLAELANGK